MLDQENDKWLTLKNSIELAKYAAIDYATELAKANALALEAVNQIKNPETVAEPEVVVQEEKKTVITKDTSKTGSGKEDVVDTRTPQQKINDLNKPIIKANQTAGLTNKKIALATAAEVQKITPKATAAPKPSGGGAKKYIALSSGGMVPQYLRSGGMSKIIKGMKPRGTDKIPAMLTPGEFVISRDAVSKLGPSALQSINNGQYTGGSVYNNYSVSVNVETDANPETIARTVVAQIKQINNQRIRGLVI